MNCEKYKDRLELLLFDELGVDEAAELNKHLSECEDCQKQYDELKEVIKIIEPDKSISLTPEEKADMLIQLNRYFTHAQPVPRSNIFSTLMKVAAAIIIFTMGFYTNSLINPAPKDIQQISNQMLAANVTQSSLKNYRLSSAGFKLIAKGKAAMEKESESN